MKKKLKPSTLLKISPEEISPNPHNPRLVFDVNDLDDLKKSIDKVGILVPLTVYKNKKKFPKTKYILLDGERRWRCAQELGIKVVPVNMIDEPADVTQNIIYMFNIHHYRREWALFPTALKLEVLIKKLDTDSETILSKFTGVSRSMIRRCKVLLWYPNKYRDVLLQKGGKISTDFFIELHPLAYRLSQEVEYRYTDGIMRFIDGCKEKLLSDVVSDVKEFREMRKCMGYYENIDNFKEFKKKVAKFIKQKDSSLDMFVIPDIEDDKKRKNILKYISYLNENLSSVNKNIISDFYFLEQLENLRNTLDKTIDKID